jgi:hypothetical protein
VNDAGVLGRWWQEVLATGGLPADVVPVQSRLVRAVGRGELPSGPVFVKVMAFPRAKDRLRYCARPLPAAHEAAMLAVVAAAGIPCPEVVAVRTARRGLLPFRSLLVLRALPVVADSRTAAEQTGEQAALAQHLLRAGVHHRDLNRGNFVRLRDGRLAVLDLQSARRGSDKASTRRLLAARLLSECEPAIWTDAGTALVASGLIAAAELPAVGLAAGQLLARWRRTRLRRCLQESSEFERRIHWCGIEHRQRGELPPGRWVTGARRRLRAAWLGQRRLQLADGRSGQVAAYFAPWWWFPGPAAVYVPAAFSDDAVSAELQWLATESCELRVPRRDHRHDRGGSPPGGVNNSGN